MTREEMLERKRALGYTNQMISQLSGVPSATVQKILSGTTKAPRYETLQALEHVLAVPAASVSDSAGFVRESLPDYQYDSSGKKPGEYTLEDYLALPDEPRVELIDGVFYDMAGPNNGHQILITELLLRLKEHVRDNGGSCMPLVSPLDVQLDCDEKTIVQPDLMVVCDRSKITWPRVVGAPDLVIEILSPSTRKKDMFIKLNKYLNAGVREYWMIDPLKKEVYVYDFEGDDYPKFYTFADTVPVAIFGGKCKIDFSELYEEMRFLYEQEE